MRVVFLQRIWHEYVGPEIISANLKKHGHQVDLFIGKGASVFLDKINPGDIVAFSIMTGEHRWAFQVADQIKREKKVLTVFGGAHPTYFPRIIEHPSVDIVCCGEGEFAMVDLADACDKGVDYSNIANLTVKSGNEVKVNEVRSLISDLDALPFPDRSIYYDKDRLLRKNTIKPFAASRGCPFSCSFCFNEKLRVIYKNKGQYVRFRSPKNLINEIKEVESKYGLKSIFFVDDVFVLNKRWLEEFTALYGQLVRKPFVCSTNVNILNEEIIKLLKEAGCHTVCFGVETGNESLRQKVLNKHVSNEQIIKTADLLKKYNLKFMTFNMVGLPGENVDNAFETIQLNIQIGTNYPRCSILTPYPGTQIAENLKEKIIVEDIDSSYQQGRISFEVTHPDQLRNIHYFFQTAVLFPRLFWFIKKLIYLPSNFLFKLWWAGVYFLVYLRSETRNPFHSLVFAIRMSKLVFKKDH